MDGEVIVQKLLNGVPVDDFIVFFIAAFVGFVLTFGWDVKEGVKKSTKTPNKWDWPSFWKGWKRITQSILLIAVSIVFWPQISQFMLDSETPINLTLWSSFGVGMALDRISAGLLGLRKKE